MTIERIALVCCRGGSTRIPGKNIKPFCGRPLLAWLLDALNAADRFDRIILSTDSEQIADVGRANGAEVPGLRPAHLATDTAVQYDTHRYIFDQLGLDDSNARIFNALNSPFTTAPIIRDAMQAAESCSWRCVVRDARRLERDDAWFSQLFFESESGLLRHRFPEDFLAGPQNRQQETRTAYLCPGRFIAVRPSMADSYDGYQRTVVRSGILPCWWPKAAPDLDLHEPEDWPLAEAMFRRAYPARCPAPAPGRAAAPPTTPWGSAAERVAASPYEPILTS